MAFFLGGMQRIGRGAPLAGVMSMELHRNSPGIPLLHGCTAVSLLRLSGALSCDGTSGKLLLNEALLLYHFLCRIAYEVSV